MLLFLLLECAVRGQAGFPDVPALRPQQPTLPTNSPSLQEIRRLIWSLPAPSATRTNFLSTSVTGQIFSTAGTNYLPDDKYKLRVGDKVSFQILEDRSNPSLLVVADSGEVEAPYVGRVAATDKTCKQLAEQLKTLLEKDYYYRATLILALDTANKVVGRVYVWGQVRNQGPVEMLVNETLTAGKAILRAGGFGDFANKRKVKIVRGGEAQGGTARTFELNMVDILENGKPEKDIALESDDFIIVSARLVNF
jgi:polysaccharide export outer membrane protein